MSKIPSLDEHYYRTGCIVDPSLILLLLEDPVLAKQDIPYTVVAIWQKDKDWYESSLDYDGIAATVVPGEAGVNRKLVIVGSTGKFTVMSGGSSVDGVIKDDDALASVNYVHNSVVAVGILGGIYKMTDSNSWEELTSKYLDENLSAVCAHPSGGFLLSGWNGLVALYNDKVIKRLESGTNVILTSIICDDEGEIFACGQKGTIVRGSKDSLMPLNLEGVKDDFWSIVKFRGDVYVSSTVALYKLVDDETLEVVKFYGEVIPTSFYHLNTYNDVLMLSVGQKDAVLFDGNEWTRIL